MSPRRGIRCSRTNSMPTRARECLSLTMDMDLIRA